MLDRTVYVGLFNADTGTAAYNRFAVLNNGVVTGVAVANHTETPTVGGKAIDEGLTDQYKNKQATTFEVGKNIDGVTGVTRTAKGVAGAVNKAVEKYNSIKGGGN